jgi:putative peptide zinc metalloprotease protein
MSTETTKLAESGWLDRPVELAPYVTVIDGADGHPLLFNAATGTYVRLSPTGARMVQLLDGTRTGSGLLEAASRSRGPDGTRDRAPALLSFLNDLRAAGALSEPPEPLTGRRRLLARLNRFTPRVRFRARLLIRLLMPPARVVGRFPRTATAVGLSAAAASVVAVILAITLPTPTAIAGPPWLLIIGVLLVQATVHEMAHAIVCASMGVLVREVGVKLFFFLIPLAYVDRTDAYRVRSRVGRSALALAGPVIDLTAAGLCSLLILLTPTHASELGWLLGFQLFVLLNNLNPLLPITDGHHALEAALGELNLRDRSFAYLRHLLFRTPLSAAHQRVTSARRRMYLAYGIISAVYLVLVLGLIGMTYYNLIVLATS